MLSTVRQIGNSRGVLIPSAFLASCAIEDQVDMRLHDGGIVITAVKRTPRNGWFEAALSEGQAVSDWDVAHLADDSEWQW
jgi:antitoxin MazE